jgi:uncharacterized protein
MPVASPGPAPAAGPLAPLPGGEREPLVDALRGLALLGVLAVNLYFMGYPQQSGIGAPVATTPGGWALDLTNLLFTGKAYALLALLFGYGVGAQALRAAAAGAHPSRLLRRRFLALGAIGLMHGLLGWYGDILVSYAAFGFCLLPFLKARQRTLLWTAAGLLLGTAALYALAGGLLQLLGEQVRGSPLLAGLTESMGTYMEIDASEARLAYGRGPYGALFQRRLVDAMSNWAGSLLMLT